MKKIISTSEAPAAVGPYSQAIRIGNFVFCSGQIPLDPKTGEIVPGDVNAQTRRVMENIAAVLRAEGLNFGNIIKTTIFLDQSRRLPGGKRTLWLLFQIGPSGTVHGTGGRASQKRAGRN